MTLVDHHQIIIQIVANHCLLQQLPRPTSAHRIAASMKINTHYQNVAKKICAPHTMLLQPRCNIDHNLDTYNNKHPITIVRYLIRTNNARVAAPPPLSNLSLNLSSNLLHHRIIENYHHYSASK